MTEFEVASQGKTTATIERLATEEGVSPSDLAGAVARGETVIVGGRDRRPLAIGGDLTIKVNANVGTSTDAADLALEGEKVALAASLGARMISDCSVGGDLDKARQTLIEASDLPVVTVPMYQTTAEAGGPEKVTPGLFLDVLERQLEGGASGAVIHGALDSELLRILRRRIMGLVSRGGQLTARWMEARGCADALEGLRTDVLELLRAHDAALIIGNAARAGCVHDRLDAGHRREAELGEGLARAANEAGVQVIVEAVGGHVHVADVADHVKVYKKQGHRPLFAAGPLTVDAAMGYDHLTATIGGAIASGAGADLLCYITPAEHLGLPTLDDVREGTICCMIAAYHGDAMRRGPLPRDLELAKARRRFDWAGQFQQALHPERAMARHRPGEGCTMCGEFCAYKVMNQRGKAGAGG
jgi:phosphomethylpyrimidine synthase